MTSSLAPRETMASGQFQDDEPPTFREVMAYLDGVAAAMTATRDQRRPVAITACTDPPAPARSPCRATSASVPRPAGNESACSDPGSVLALGSKAHLTLRYGELAMAVDRVRSPSAAPPILQSATPRGGARLIDLGAAGGSPHLGAPGRNTLPYGIKTLSLAPRYTPTAAWVEPAVDLTPTISILDETVDCENVRTSDVYLRCARLSAEWYDLTGTEEE